ALPISRYCIQASDFKVSRMVYAPLVSTDTDTTDLKFELAERVTPVGNDWEIVLRDGARFSDGKPVTTDDVLYTFETLQDPKIGGAAARIRRGFAEAGLQSLEVHDQKRMTVHLAHAHAPFITDM